MKCISKNLSDTYINAFAAGSHLPLFDYSDIEDGDTILIRGMTKSKLIKDYWNKQYTFYYMDTGYFGNYISAQNPFGNKIYHRIVKNDLQHTKLLSRPGDRWEKLKIPLKERKSGSHILLVLPSEKPCKFYNINLDNWITDTISEIKKYTDREIVIRKKNPRKDRISDPIENHFVNAHCTVTFNSIAAVESIVNGVPAITLAPNAADPVSEKFISNIENPYTPDIDLVYEWVSGLAYGQYHIDELKNGTAYKLLYEYS